MWVLVVFLVVVLTAAGLAFIPDADELDDEADELDLTVDIAENVVTNDGPATVVRFVEIPGRRFMLTWGKEGAPDLARGARVKGLKRTEGDRTFYRFP
jgi:hypothetical protein